MNKLNLDEKAWIRSLAQLIQKGEYDEALGLAPYFPDTLENQFLRCAASVGTNYYWDAGNMFEQLSLDISETAPDWTNLFAMNGKLLLEKTVELADHHQFKLSHLCWQATLFTESIAERDLAVAFCRLLIRALRIDKDYAIDLFAQLRDLHYPLQEAIRAVCEDYYPNERRDILLTLVGLTDRIPSDHLGPFLEELLKFEIELSEEDVYAIRDRLGLATSNIKEIVENGLDTQRISRSREDQAIWARAAGWPRGFSGDFIGGEGDYIGGEKEMEMEVEELAPKSTVTLVRHTRVDFPSECCLGKKVTLSIQLTKAVPTLTRVLKKISVLVARDVKTVHYDIYITAPTFDIKEHKKTMSMPVDGDSEQVSFDMVPTEWGTQTFEIEVFHGSSRVGYLLVDTWVFNGPAIAEPSNLLVMEDPVEHLDESMSLEGLHRRMIWVNWNQRQGKITYDLKPSAPDDDDLPCDKSFPQLQRDIQDYLKNLNEFLNEAVVQANPSDELWQSICLNLEGYGRTLFDQLIPPQIAERSRQWPPDATVIVSTNENWIPWELLFDGEDFWGRKFCLARYPRFTDAIQKPKKSRPKIPSLRPIKKALNAIGGDILKPHTEKASKLFENLLATDSVKVLKARPISVFEENLSEMDIVHCTCHGRTRPHMLQLSGNNSRLENLLPETIGRLSLQKGCFVFANACSSNVPVLTFGKFGSFGWEFYRRGAKIFLGTLGAVPVKYAVPFAESIYKHLFSEDKSTPTIGQAMARAKRAASKDRNLFWLLYMIYGDPDLTLKLKH